MTTMAEQLFDDRLNAKFGDADLENLIEANDDPTQLAIRIVERIIEDSPELLSDKPLLKITLTKPAAAVIADIEARLPGCGEAFAGIAAELPPTVRTDMEFRFLPDGSGFCRIQSDEYFVAAKLIDLVEPEVLFNDHPEIPSEEYPAIIEAFKAVFNAQTGMLCMPFTPASFGEIRASMLGIDGNWKDGYQVTTSASQPDDTALTPALYDRQAKACLDAAAQNGTSDIMSRLRKARAEQPGV